MEFSNEEFDIMVEELLYKEPMSFDMLCNIADKTLRSKVRYWCANDKCLKGRGYEEDIMQEIQVRLMKTTVTHFLLKSGTNGQVNYDPKGFKSWMNKVAENLKRDFSNKVRNRDFKTENIDNPMIEDEVSVPGPEFDDDKLQRLKEAFSVVLSANVNVYKILTWIAQFIYMIEYDITKIESNHVILDAFEQKTLFEMYDIILKKSTQIAWIEISPSQNERITKELNEILRDGVVYGDIKYREFFMKTKGKKDGKKSLSDWVNRINDIIKKNELKKTTKKQN